MGSKLLKQEDGRLIFRCAFTGQPMVVYVENIDATELFNTSPELEKYWPWICFPIARCALIARGILLVDSGMKTAPDQSKEQSKELGLLSDTFNFVEAASILLGAMIDLQCKADEITMLRDLHRQHQKLCQGPLSIRDIYRNGLGAIYRQLVFACRISILQLQPTSTICTKMDY